MWRALTTPAGLNAWFPVRVLDFSAVDPPSTLECTWAGEVPRWELTPHDDGCLPVFTDASGETAEIRDGWSLDVVTGWHVSLDVLAEHLAGVRSTASVWDRAEALKPSYPRTGE